MIQPPSLRTLSTKKNAHPSIVQFLGPSIMQRSYSGLQWSPSVSPSVIFVVKEPGVSRLHAHDAHGPFQAKSGELLLRRWRGGPRPGLEEIHGDNAAGAELVKRRGHVASTGAMGDAELEDARQFLPGDELVEEPGGILAHEGDAMYALSNRLELHPHVPPGHSMLCKDMGGKATGHERRGAGWRRRIGLTVAGPHESPPCRAPPHFRA